MRENGESSGTVKEAMEKKREKEMVMDTPDKGKTQITAPMSTFEDSPVFNFLNSLSPIKPVKSVHITQSLNTLSFASPPSVFTSPNVRDCFKESRFLRRHQLGDPSKPEFSSDNVNKDDTNEMILDVAPNYTQNQENVISEGSIQASVEPSYECSKLAADLVQEEYDVMLQGTEAIVEWVSQIEQQSGAEGCDWQAISDAADLLILYSPNDRAALNKSVDPETMFKASISNDEQNAQALVAVGSGDRVSEGSELDNRFTQPEEENEPRELSETLLGVNCMAGDTVDSVDPETASNLYRGMRRRCLVFELSGARKKHSHEISASDSAMVSQSDGLSHGNESSRCVLPGFGLHLNTLATTSKECKIIKNEAFASGRQPLIAPSSAFHSSNKLVNVTQSDRELAPVENGGSLMEDGGVASSYMINEEYNQNSPKKKRRVENGEGEACKRCTCKKSKCLKLYCECFAAGVYCVEPCSCLECFNKPIHEETVLATRKQIESRNPLAFAPKVIRTSDPLSETGVDPSKTPASARHKRGCNCKKSGCLKKYCECYQGGVGCSINCRCEGCKNAFGRKDGPEVEFEEEEETDMNEKSVVDRSHHRIVFQSDAEHNQDYILPATPLSFGRPSMQLPFPSNNKPSRSTFLHIGSSSAFHTNQGFGKPNFFLPQTKFDNSFGTVQEDEMPEILQTDGSPSSCVKSASPNSKRVSPPHYGRGGSPGQRSSRKLILQSIPSFPSLTPKR